MEKIKQIGNLYSRESRDNPNQGRVYDTEAISPTLTTMKGGNKQPFIIENFYSNCDLRVRKLTPRECWRLMNIPDADFDKAQEVISNSRLYSCAGNAIVVSCLMALFSQLNITGIKTWNDMEVDEIYEKIYKEE